MPHLCRGRYRRGQDNGMTRSTRVRGNQAVRKIIVGLFVLGFVGVGAGLWTSHAAEEPAKQTEEKGPASAEAGGECCKAGDTTPPTELVDKIPAGQLHSPYPDYAKLAKEQDLVKDFRLPGCNECHGGGGGGGMCPALSQGIWFWGNTDDVLFRLVTLGSAELEKRGFDRITYGSVHAPMPPMGFAVKTSDDLWKIIAFIRSINPPGANPPEKVVPARMKQ
jgi:mono/diheme cytochrome c family protein